MVQVTGGLLFISFMPRPSCFKCLTNRHSDSLWHNTRKQMCSDEMNQCHYVYHPLFAPGLNLLSLLFLLPVQLKQLQILKIIMFVWGDSEEGAGGGVWAWLQLTISNQQRGKYLQITTSDVAPSITDIHVACICSEFYSPTIIKSKPCFYRAKAWFNVCSTE